MQFLFPMVYQEKSGFKLFQEKNITNQYFKHIDKEQIRKNQELQYKGVGGIFALFVDSIIGHAKHTAEA